MDAGLNIIDGVRIRLGDSLSEVRDNLTNNNIEYKIHNSKGDTDGLDTAIMFMEKYGVELSINSGKIIYIKSNNSSLNYVIEITDNMDILFTLNEIKEKVAKMFNVSTKSIRIDEFDGDNTKTILTIKDNEGRVVKISLILGIKNRIYMHTIKLDGYNVYSRKEN